MIAFFVIAIVGIPIFLMIWERTPYVSGQENPYVQPVKFDHRHHVRDNGIDCLYCHGDAERSAYAGVPATALCMNCHSQVWAHSPELASVRASYFEGTSLRWQRVDRLPKYVFFNHSIHLSKGVGCVSCHGRIDLMGQVYAVAPLTMQWCLDCHRHPEQHLRPLDRITDLEWKPDRPQLEVGRELKERLSVNPSTDCTGCHR